MSRVSQNLWIIWIQGEERILDDHFYFPNGGDESRTRPEPGYRDSFYPGAAKPELRPQDEFRSREKYFMELAVFIDRDLHRSVSSYAWNF